MHAPIAYNHALINPFLQDYFTTTFLHLRRFHCTSYLSQKQTFASESESKSEPESESEPETESESVKLP